VLLIVDLLQRVSIPCFEVVSGSDHVIEYHDEMVQVSNLHQCSILCTATIGLYLTSYTRNVLPNVQGEIFSVQVMVLLDLLHATVTIFFIMNHVLSRDEEGYGGEPQSKFT